MTKTTPIYLITGYLGSGKTTLIKNLLQNKEQYKIAVIVNDIGEINIDASLISKGGKLSNTANDINDTVIPLSNGCICCSLQTDLLNQILELLKQKKYDYIFIEASGICEPIPIAQSIMYLSGPEDISQGSTPPLCKLSSIVAVVDANRLATEFASGKALLENKSTSANTDYPESFADITGLLVQQIEFCSLILLNKTELVSSEQLSLIKQIIYTLQPHATIIETNYCNMDLKYLLTTPAFDFETVFQSAGWVKILDSHDKAHHHEHECKDPHCHHHSHHSSSHTEEFGISTFVYYRRQPFDRVKLDTFAAHWPKNVIRSKGMVWFSDDNIGAYVLEQAGSQVTASFGGNWLASGEDFEIEEAFAADPLVKENWDDTVGDRMVKLVLIGIHMDKEKISALLDQCLTTPTDC
jgi:G3E family GTPase